MNNCNSCCEIDILASYVMGNANVIIIQEKKQMTFFQQINLFLKVLANTLEIIATKKAVAFCSACEGIPDRLTSIEKTPIERFFIELNFHKKKWIVNCF